MDNAVEPSGRMLAYSPEHVIVLVVIVLAAAASVIAARRIRGTTHEDVALRAAGWVMLIVTGAWTVWGMLPGQWNIDQSLPFHFSDAIRFITAIALITRAGWAICLTYFWGLTLNLQSIITPDLVYFDYPALEFAAYWFLHGAALIVPIVFVWGLGYRPTWRGFAITYAAAAGWAAVSIGVNTVTGANYGYFSHAPAGPSALDFLGPWPVYILWEAIIAAVVWAAMTWPWQRRADTAAGRRSAVYRQQPARSRTIREPRAVRRHRENPSKDAHPESG